MKMDVPETEAWRRRRAEELGVVASDPWSVPHPRNTRADVAPMRAPVAPPPPAAGSTPTRAPAADRPIRRPVPPPEPVASVRQGSAAKASAVAAGLLFAVAAGWQARDFLDPAATVPPSAEPQSAQRAAPVAVTPRPEALRCDDPAVVAALRDRIASGVVREGGDPAWGVRVAAEARLSVAPPSVTSLGADGARFCGTRLTVVPPGGPPMAPVPVTYSVGPKGEVSDVQGDVGTIRRLVAMSAPAPKPVAVEPSAAPEPKRSPPPAEVEPRVPVRAKTAAEPKPVIAQKSQPETKAATPAKRASGPPLALLPPPAVVRSAPADSTASTCGDVWSRAEAMICASPSLKAQHRALTATLDRILLSGEANTIKRAIGGQRRFLARRDNCKDAACVAKRYDDRLADLAKIEAKGNMR